MQYAPKMRGVHLRRPEKGKPEQRRRIAHYDSREEFTRRGGFGMPPSADRARGGPDTTDIEIYIDTT
jgi:hypothetical protein